MAKVVLTGVSRGLGRALAVALDASGHQVHGCCRELKQAPSLSGRSRVDRCDVTDPEQVADWASRCDPAPDLLINNAGYFSPRAPLVEVDPDHFQRVLQVNVLGPMLVARAFLPGMMARGRGVVVNFTSARARNPAPEVGPYACSKAAVETMTRTLALELPRGMAAVAVSPGVIHTDMLEVSIPEQAGDYWGPDQWVQVALPFLLGLGPEHNGEVVRIPDP